MSDCRFPPFFTPPPLLCETADNAPVLVALSGGADSVALLALLRRYAQKTGAPLSVAHVNHSLRGAESDRDAEFCRALAKEYGLPFHLLEVDVAARAKVSHRGIEEEAREARYEFFATLMKEHGIPLLATAHHADDNAETVLLHLTRGCGLRGLRGISPARPFADGTLIRPLLTATKEELISFCEENRLSYVTDSTNDDVTFARNRIRRNVLTELRRVNPELTDSVTRLCRAATRDDDYLTQSTRQFLADHQRDDGSLPLDALNGAHPAIGARAVALMLSSVREPSSKHVEAVLALARNAVPHSQLHPGDGVCVRIEDDALTVTALPDDETEPPSYERFLQMGENPIPEADALLLIEAEPSQKDHEIYRNIYKKETTTEISSDKIERALLTRPKRDGDVILAGGMHKKVKKLMCERKLPLPLRNRLPLVLDADGILWIPHVALRDGAKGRGVTFTLFYND